MNRFALIAIVFFATFAGAMPQDVSSKDPEVVPAVDFQRYVGFWYEIAHDKNFFQRKCVRSTAEYQILSATEVSVHNVCYKENNETTDISGVATVNNPAEPAKLRVKFNFFLRGDYWIVDLDPNYQWAVVSAPKKKSLFILSRTAPMDATLLNELLTRLQSKGFDTEGLIFDKY